MSKTSPIPGPASNPDPADPARRNLLLRGLSFGAALALPVRTGLAACTLTPELTEGPYYIDRAKLRRDIREDRSGIPLRLRIALLDARTCRPLRGAAVDVWHCDALGVYSGYTQQLPPPFGGPPGSDGLYGPHGPGGPPPGFEPGMPPPPGGPEGMGGHPPHKPQPGDRLTFLRGVQFTDAAGLACFDTLFPGWYAGRAVHIHLKVHTGGKASGARYRGGHVCHTGQIAFPEDACERVSRLPPYADHRIARIRAEQDGIFSGGSAPGSTLKLSPLAARPDTVPAGYTGEIAFAVDPEASPRLF